MTKVITLKRNGDFRRVYGRGKALSSPVLVVYYLKNRAGVCRIGITTSKKIGNAVERNRSRRVIREGVRAVLPRIKPGYDFVFVARGRTKRVKSTDISAALLSVLSAEGLLRPAES